MQDDHDLPEIMLNLWLTAHGAREACYFDVYENTEEEVEALQRALHFAGELGLDWTFHDLEESGRNILFTRIVPHEPLSCAILGARLGFTWGKRDYTESPRLVPQIYCTFEGWSLPTVPAPTRRIQVFAYVAEVIPQVYAASQERLDLWNQVLRDHPFPYAARVHLEQEVGYEA